ncbi:MAG TPA: contractile injection system protein, VgrG/Pvc8 family [Anaeromyxobacteraceae bacterium]|nr:contractile injection system protein, VgrG/Pvc8 family [Anaeromyxobacteraceae bacterium]
MPTATVDRPLLYSARPVLTVAGQARPELAAALSSLAVAETTDGLFHLEATVGNWGAAPGGIGYLYFGRDVLDFGAEVAVEMGAGDAQGKIFAGRISALEARFPIQRPPEITFLAEDRLQDLRMTRRTRTFEQASLTDVVRRVASDHGLTPDLDVDDLTLPVFAQLDQTDLAFLRDLARMADAELWADGTTLHLQARARRRGASVTLTFGQTLREFQVTADLAHQRTSLRVSGWDVDGKAAIDEEATDACLGGEVGSMASGASVLRSKLGDRVERVVHAMPVSTREARARAEAAFRRDARRFVCGRAVAEGDARLRVGARVTLGELGPLFNGAYDVTETRHLFDWRNGYRTLFTVERPGLGNP